MAGKRLSALAAALGAIKAEAKAERSPSGMLHWIIDDYCSQHGRFDEYLATHTADSQKYLPITQERPTRWRASSAGRCPQQQAYEVLAEEIAANLHCRPIEAVDSRIIAIKPQHARAMWNGTFSHVRWHMIFDALHDLGRVETLETEVTKYNFVYNVSGTVDRVIRFEFDKRPFTAILDFKTIKSYYFQSLIKPKPDHLKQLHTYFLLDFEADDYMVMYEDKDTQVLKIFDAPYSELTIKALKTMYTSMGKWITQFLDGVPRQERIKLPLVTDWCMSCPYLKICDIENPHRGEVEPGTDEIVF